MTDNSIPKVIRVSRSEFELDNGAIYPIDPPLDEPLPSIEEFQSYYEEVRECLGSIESFRSIREDYD